MPVTPLGCNCLMITSSLEVVSFANMKNVCFQWEHIFCDGTALNCQIKKLNSIWNEQKGSDGLTQSL